MTISAMTPDDGCEDQALLDQAAARNRRGLDVPPANLGEPTWLANLSPDVRAKAAAGLARGRDNVIQLHGRPEASCTCPRPGERDYLMRNLGKCPACQKAREENRAEALALQSRFRQEVWQRGLQEDFVDFIEADLAGLKPQQDPDGKVSGWLDSGSRTLILAGESSRGKTHAAFAIANHAARQKDLWVVAWNVSDFHDALRPGGNPRTYEFAERCDLLVYDDMGAEKVTEAVRKATYQLFDSRVRNHRRSVICTNLPYDDRGFGGTPKELQPVRPNLIDLYSSRIVHRIMQEATVVRVQGEALRKPVPW